MDEATRRERTLTRRKRAGVVYTPAPIARFLVARTIALSLDERRADLLAEHGGRATVDFWRDWLAHLRAFTILDPACGEGALLLAACDEMAPRYEEAARELRALGAAQDIDAAAETIAQNLFGVDIDPQAAESARRALSIRADAMSEPDGARSDRRSEPRTFRHAARAQLDTNLRAGDSLVDEREASAAAFDWRAAFPAILECGGFDVAIGNPPYVRMEYLKALKPWLARHYAVAAERADLYAYFFERGLALLKQGGRLGYICSASFFRTGSGAPLRALLARESTIESVVDFGDLKIFDGVVTYPAIVTLRKGATTGGDLSFVQVGDRLPDDLRIAFARTARPLPRSRLGAGFWRFEDDATARLREKIVAGRETLRDAYGAPLWGVKTGLNDAFVIDEPTRDRLVAADARSAELLQPYLRGAHIGRWTVAPERLFLIDLPKGAIDDIAGYPAIAAHLAPLRARLEARATRQRWFELQQAQRAYRAAFAGPKIVFPDISQGPKFAFDPSGSLIDATAFALPHADLALLALLNSRLVWFFLHSVSNPLRGGKWRLRLKAQYVELVPVPSASAKLRARLAEAARANLAAARRLARAGAEEAARIAAQIDAKEREIDEIVYALFDLSAEEIARITHSLAGQY